MQRFFAFLALATVSALLIWLFFSYRPRDSGSPSGAPAQAVPGPKTAKQPPADFFKLAQTVSGPVRPYSEQLLISSWVVLAQSVERSTGVKCYRGEVGVAHGLPTIPETLVTFAAKSANGAHAQLAALVAGYIKNADLLYGANGKGHLDAYVRALGQPSECLEAFRTQASQSSQDRLSNCVGVLTREAGEWLGMPGTDVGPDKVPQSAGAQTPGVAQAEEVVARAALFPLLKESRAAALALVQGLNDALLAVGDPKQTNSLYTELVEFNLRIISIIPGQPRVPVLDLAPAKKLIDVYSLFVTQFHESTKERYDAFLVRIRRELGDSQDGQQEQLKKISLPVAGDIKTELLALLQRPEVAQDTAKKGQVTAAISACDQYDEGSSLLRIAIHGDASSAAGPKGLKELLAEPLHWIESLDSGVQRLKDQSVTDPVLAAEVVKGLMRSIVGDPRDPKAAGIRQRMDVHKESVATRLSYIVEEAASLKKVYDGLLATLDQIRVWANSPELDKKVEVFKQRNTALWDTDLPVLINIVFLPVKLLYCSLSWIWGDPCTLGGGSGGKPGENGDGADAPSGDSQQGAQQDPSPTGGAQQNGTQQSPSTGEVPGAKMDEFRSLEGLPSVVGPVKYRIGHDVNSPNEFVFELTIEGRLPSWRRVPFKLRQYEQDGRSARFGALAKALESQGVKFISFGYPDVGEPWPLVANFGLHAESKPPHDWSLQWADLDAVPELLEATQVAPGKNEVNRSLSHRPSPSVDPNRIPFGFEAVEGSGIVRLVIMPQGRDPIRLRFPTSNTSYPDFTADTIRHLAVLKISLAAPSEGSFPIDVEFDLNGPDARLAAAPQHFAIKWLSAEIGHFGAGSPTGK